jgi:AAA domain
MHLAVAAVLIPGLAATAPSLARAGLAVVVGRAGTGKSFALGMARHAWQLGGYRLLAWAPSGSRLAGLHAPAEGQGHR